MSQRRKTVPPTRVSSRSSRTGRSGLIAKEKTEKQSVKERTALDNRFHRTDHTLIWSDLVKLRERCLSVLRMAVKRQTESAAATMIILICAGWVPHDDDASGAASV